VPHLSYIKYPLNENFKFNPRGGEKFVAKHFVHCVLNVGGPQGDEQARWDSCSESGSENMATR